LFNVGASRTTGNPIREYIWMGDMPAALVDRTGMSPVIYFIHTDHLNRPQKLDACRSPRSGGRRRRRGLALSA
jgi:hypothetical protein